VWTGAILVAVVVIAVFLLLLSCVGKNVVRNGMREHQVWLESRLREPEEMSR
jgi:hypothetical protein